MEEHEMRALAAQRQDPQLAARIVRSIEQIETDSHLAYGAVSQRLMTEIGSSARSAVPDSWTYESTDDGLTITTAEWKSSFGNQRDAYFALADLVEDDTQDHSWVAVAMSKGHTQLILELKLRPQLTQVMQALIDKDPVIKNLVTVGFKRDSESKRLYMPIMLDAGAIAIGFECNDLHEALEPLREVVGKAIASRAPIDAMLAHIRAEAKKR